MNEFHNKNIPINRLLLLTTTTKTTAERERDQMFEKRAFSFIKL